MPLVAYLFFASGINNFAKLPILTDSIQDLESLTNHSFENNISIVTFLGNDIEDREGDALNLNQKIFIPRQIEARLILVKYLDLF